MFLVPRALAAKLFPNEVKPAPTPAPLPDEDVSITIRFIPDGTRGDELAVATVIMQNVAGTPCFVGQAAIEPGKYGRQVAMMEASDAARTKARHAGFDMEEVQWQVRAKCVHLELPKAKVYQFKR